MRKLFLGMAGMLLCTSAQAAITSFGYTQTDGTTGSGTIAGFSYDPGDGGGPIVFDPTPMPVATVINPNPGLTPAGFIGAQTALMGAANEVNTAVGLKFPASVTANGTRNATNYTITIPLKFVPKVTQAPDADDYTWNVTYGDDAGAGGTDAVSAAGLRFAMLFSRDDLVNGADTANTFQRYTQLTQTFAAGQTTFTNDNTSVANIINDATDAGDPQGTDAAGRPLEFYFGWRDTSSLTSGAILLDTFTVGGLLDADPSTLTPPVPEPTAVGLLVGAALLGMRRRHRA